VCNKRALYVLSNFEPITTEVENTTPSPSPEALVKAVTRIVTAVAAKES